MASIFPDVLKRTNFVLSWTDEDDDNIVIDNDEELIVALTEMKGPIYKIICTVTGVQSNSNSNNGGGVHHVGVACDGCEKEVAGPRYKCTVCEDYDLCGACEARGMHPAHNMIRIATPESAWPKHFFSRLNKMHERMNGRRAARAAAAAAAAAEQAGQEEESGGFARGGGRAGRGGSRRGRGGKWAKMPADQDPNDKEDCDDEGVDPDHSERGRWMRKGGEGGGWRRGGPRGRGAGMGRGRCGRGGPAGPGMGMGVRRGGTGGDAGVWSVGGKGCFRGGPGGAGLGKGRGREGLSDWGFGKGGPGGAGTGKGCGKGGLGGFAVGLGGGGGWIRGGPGAAMWGGRRWIKGGPGGTGMPGSPPGLATRRAFLNRMMRGEALDQDQLLRMMARMMRLRRRMAAERSLRMEGRGQNQQWPMRPGMARPWMTWRC